MKLIGACFGNIRSMTMFPCEICTGTRITSCAA